MNIKNQQAINQVLRKKRVAEQIKNQKLQHQLFLEEGIIPDPSMEYTSVETFKETYEIMMKRGGSFLCSLDVLRDSKLTSHAKVLFQVISSLSYNEG
jgi:hypothetical protein